MGMSASQMRYSMLAGKQNDVQYQGQQINQERTVLATESSALNSQLLGLSVPTPPSSSDFSKVSYTFSLNDGSAANCSVTGTSMEKDTNGKYTGYYTVGYSYSSIGEELKNASKIFTKTATGYSVYVSSNKLSSLTKVDLTATDSDTTAEKAQLKSIYGTNYATSGSTYYMFQDSDGNNCYVSDSELSNVLQNTDDKGSVKYHYLDESATITESDQFTGSTIKWTDSGRMSSFTDANGNTHTLSCTTTTDDTAYNNAMNEYQYKKDEYDHEMSSINAKIDVIQNDDKKLELQLQNLDTQNSALQTEMESVKKVIDKNIETSFKAFNA